MADDKRKNKNQSSQAYKALEKYTRDLTEMAKNGSLDPVVGRDDEIRRTIQVIARRTKNNPVLIGDPGVGKTAIAEGLALRIINGDIPESLKDKKLLSLDLGSVVAGAKFRGEFEERLTALLDEITRAAGEIILFIDELHTLVGTGAAEGSLDASNMLKPALARGTLHCIGATTLDEYRKHIEKDAALARRFQPIFVNEPSISETINILRGLKEKYELHHGLHETADQFQKKSKTDVVDVKPLKVSNDPSVLAVSNFTIQATADSWIQIKALNSNILLSRILKTHETYNVPNRNDLLLSTGNIGALVIRINGKEIPKYAGSIRVAKDIALTKENLLKTSDSN